MRILTDIIVLKEREAYQPPRGLQASILEKLARNPKAQAEVRQKSNRE